MSIRGIQTSRHALVLGTLLASVGFIGCGGGGPKTETAGPESTVVKAREAAHQEKLKLQEEQKAKRK